MEQNKFFEGYGDNPDKGFMDFWVWKYEIDVIEDGGQGVNDLCDSDGNSFKLPDYLPF